MYGVYHVMVLWMQDGCFLRQCSLPYPNAASGSVNQLGVIGTIVTIEQENVKLFKTLCSQASYCQCSELSWALTTKGFSYDYLNRVAYVTFQTSS